MSQQPPHSGGFAAPPSSQPPDEPGGRAGRTPARDSPRNPLFFLSYAHSPDEQRKASNTGRSEPQVGDFFIELSENIGQLIGRKTGSEPGYMDRSIPSGSRWTDELLGTIGRCQVFIPLLSAPYFDSEWCGMEWYAFSQRQVIVHSNAVGNHTAIIPVIWAPVPDEQTPKVVSAVQRFSADGLGKIAGRYVANGLYGLQRRGFTSDYQTIIWELAMFVRDIKYALEVEPLVLKREDLRNIFGEQWS